MRDRGVLQNSLVVAKCCLPRGEGRQRAEKPGRQHDFEAVGQTDASLLFEISPGDQIPRARQTRCTRRSLPLSGVVDHVDRGAGGQKPGENILGNSSPQHALLARAVRRAAESASDLGESVAGAIKKNQLPTWKRCRIHSSNFSTRVLAIRWSVRTR